MMCEVKTPVSLIYSVLLILSSFMPRAVDSYRIINHVSNKSHGLTSAAKLRQDETLRSRRQDLGLSESQLSWEHTALMLDGHNLLRSYEEAANMKFMVWNRDLASMAQTWAQICEFKHGQPAANPTEHLLIGQNLFSTTEELDPGKCLQAWFNEKSNYDHEKAECMEYHMCSHYLQMAWAETFEIGCGVEYCEPLNFPQTGEMYEGWLLVCNYTPVGNILGERPYIVGAPCTQCSSGQFSCFNSQCRNTTDCIETNANCTCEAGAACQHGSLPTPHCTCECAPGFYGGTCTEKCEDKDVQCGSSPGWPESYCDENHPTVLELCPLMCKLCQTDMDVTVRKFTSRSASLKASMAVSVLFIFAIT